MLFNAVTLVTLATAAFAVPNEKRTVDPVVASLDLYNVLPTSLKSIALTNAAEAGTLISAEFATGTPSWFSSLDPEVQTYFLTKGADAIPTTAAVPLSTSLSGGNASVPTGKFSNSTITSTAAATSNIAAATSSLESAAASSSASSSSSAGGAMPTQIVGAGLAGALGLVGLLAL